MGHTFSSFIAETTKLLILALGTFPGNLNSKELKGLATHSLGKTPQGVHNLIKILKYKVRR